MIVEIVKTESYIGDEDANSHNIVSHVRDSHIRGSHYLEEIFLDLNDHVFGIHVLSRGILFKFLDLFRQGAVEELIEEYEEEFLAYVELEGEY